MEMISRVEQEVPAEDELADSLCLDFVPKQLHVLDIETPSTRKDSAVLTLGVVTIDLPSLSITGQDYMVFDAKEQRQLGRHFCDITLHDFWVDRKKVSQKAYDAAWNTAPYGRNADLLHRLNQYLKDNTPNDGRIAVVGNGCDFDNVIMEGLMEIYGIPPAWNFYDNHHLRTFRLMANMLLGKAVRVVPEIMHHAHYDALAEADSLLKILRGFAELRKLTVQRNVLSDTAGDI